jgi:hypothetical protein
MWGNSSCGCLHELFVTLQNFTMGRSITRRNRLRITVFAFENVKASSSQKKKQLITGELRPLPLTVRKRNSILFKKIPFSSLV